ncbi:MAG: hypothetical protein WAL52_12390 [Candidatus Sulfotelmatobacter sp.]
MLPAKRLRLRYRGASEMVAATTEKLMECATAIGVEKKCSIGATFHCGKYQKQMAQLG